MNTDYFSSSHKGDLLTLEIGSRIHFTGVSGVAMGQLAAALAKDGYKISGSDQSFYEPMGSFLKSSGISLYPAYSPDNITKDLKLVVIGNAVKSTHPEVLEVANKAIPFISFAELLFQYLIRGKKSLVISGTHGKTTTTAICAQVLTTLNQSPSYFFGGVLPGFPSSLIRGTGNVSVVEGDEYDTAFFAKVPKFSFYKPDVWVINALEYDHADIYSSIEAIISEFESQLSKLNQNQTVIVCLDFKILSEKISEWKSKFAAKFITFGLSEESDYRITSRKTSATGQQIQISSPDKQFELQTSLFGAINARNVLAAYLGLAQTCPQLNMLNAFQNLTAVKRRLEVFAEFSGNTYIEDFAHHPTAVRETLQTLREIYPGKKIFTIFEPASNTSRRNIFQNEFSESFSLSDSLILLAPKAKGSETLLDAKKLLNDCRAPEVKFLAENSDEIMNCLNDHKPSDSIIVLMSNGAFDGLKAKIISAAAARGE